MATQHNMVGIGIAAILVLLVLAAFTPAASVVEVYQNDSIQAAINASSNQTDMHVVDNITDQTNVTPAASVVEVYQNDSIQAAINASSNQMDMHVVDNITDQTAFTPAASAVEVHQGDSIQAAINAATPGETIIVHDGMYKENLVVNKSDIVIRSANGSAVTIISSNQTDAHVVNITDQTNVTFQGFTIRDAEGTSTSVAGIYLDTTNNCTISDIAVTDIYAAGEGNTAWGIYVGESEDNTLDYLSFGNGVAD